MDRLRAVARRVRRGAVGFLQHQRRDLAPEHVGDLDDDSALRVYGHTRFEKPLDDRQHQVVDGRLAVVGIEGNPQTIVGLHESRERQLAELLPELADDGIALLELQEIRARALADAGVLLALLVGAHVELDEIVDRPLAQLRLVAPLLPRIDHEAELRAPVADEVTAHDPVAHELQHPREIRADVRGAQVAEVEGLGDVRRGELDDGRLPVAQIPAAIRLRLRQHFADHAPRGLRAVQVEVQVRALGQRLLYQRIRRDSPRQTFRDGLRRRPLLLRELEAGKGKVAEREVRGLGEELRHLGRAGRRVLQRGAQGARDVVGKGHCGILTEHRRADHELANCRQTGRELLNPGRTRARFGCLRMVKPINVAPPGRDIPRIVARDAPRFMKPALWVPLLAYAAASLLHHVHNAAFIGDYPNMPAGLSPAGVYAAWLGVTAVGAGGYMLLRRGYRRAGLAALMVYAALGLDGLAHYVLAPLSAHALTMNVTIWLEVGTAVTLLAALAHQLRRS